MTDALFNEVHFSQGELVEEIGLGLIVFPYIQRLFVWVNAEARSLFDSMYRDCFRLVGAAA